jgi:hypothetical protein
MLEMVFEKAGFWQLIFLFIAVSLPGLVSMHVYRLVFAHHDLDWKTAFQESVFWGLLNLAIFAVFAIPVYGVLTCFSGMPTYLMWIVLTLAIPFFIFVLPALLPLLWNRILMWDIVRSVVNFPCPTAWDWFFGVLRKEKCFVLVHLKNGEKIAGYYGSDSYATSFPRNGDIYLEKTVKVDNEGNFLDFVDNTLGLIVTRDEYSYVELFEVPTGEQQNSHSDSQGDDNVV